jgi:hypothetical protein
MEEKKGNKNLHRAKTGKKDEFYTRLEDIEREIRHYKEQFRDKVVYCNCDDPRISNFFHYFSYNFEKLGIKKLITTCYKNQQVDLFSTYNSEKSIYLEYQGDTNSNRIPDLDEIDVNYLQGDGDFRSKESIELLKQCDIVVTNPPFSLFREYLSQLIEYDKQFLIIGNINSISYKECFELIKENKMWLGYNTVRHFQQPDGTIYETARSFWYTNLDIQKRHENLILYKKYTPEEYPTYDNYDAINVNHTTDIPMDYSGKMGVPITFLDKYNPNQFEIHTLGIGEDNFTPTKRYSKFRDPITKEEVNDKRDFLLYVRDPNGKYLTSEGYRVNKVYARIIISNKLIQQ